MAKLIIIRGTPGSGKSTKARQIMESDSSFVHYEADMYFMKDGVYQYDGENIRNAHWWCQNSVRDALAEGKNVIVSNTFIKKKDMREYLKMAEEGQHEVEIIVARGNYKNVHDVPEEVLERMRSNWQE